MEEQLPTTKLNFGQAIEGVNQGKKAFRAGWNGKGMFVYLNRGSVDRTDDKSQFVTKQWRDHLIDGINPNLFDNGFEGTVTRLPNLNMKSATGSTLTGWLASQTDILAEDWNLVDDSDGVEKKAD